MVRGRATDKPPDEKDAAVSVIPPVAPTEVTLQNRRYRQMERFNAATYKGQSDGKVGMKFVLSIAKLI
jgi:hypothetical protein